MALPAGRGLNGPPVGQVLRYGGRLKHLRAEGLVRAGFGALGDEDVG
ncbi:MAG: hypothetical protein ACODAD_11585 [Planctomycetota bacterium]